MFNIGSDKINFISSVNGLESMDECIPKPAKNFIPQWFKDIPSSAHNTVKDCPSFPDYFSQGYIIPMWSDVKLISDGNDWGWETSTNQISWDNHSNSQLLDYVGPSFNGIDTQFVFKANCPWKITTPKGWSVLQLPLFYHFNKDWSVMPGIIDTDIHCEINQQVLYHGNGKEIIIKKGEPFVLYVPFKRSNKLKHEVRYQTTEDHEMINRLNFAFRTSFPPSGYYRKLQRKRDK